MNRLKEMSETDAWHLMVGAALEGARRQGYAVKRQPGRGLSNIYDLTKGGKTLVASVRTSRDRYIAFPPLDDGKRFKTLDDVEAVLVAAVDDRHDPQNVDVYLFPADIVRKHFDAAYAARLANGNTIRNNYGMWLMLDEGSDLVVSQVGHGLTKEFPAVTRLTIDELERSVSRDVRNMALEATPETGETAATAPTTDPATEPFETVAEVLGSARQRIAALTGMPVDKIRLDLKMGI